MSRKKTGAPAQQIAPEVPTETHKPQRSGQTVTVGCKLPHGLRLRLFEGQDISVPVLGGGTRTERRAMQIGETVVLNGNAIQFGKIPDYLIVAGFAMTPGVDADFFRKWMRDNADSEIVKQGLVFAQDRSEAARSEATERKALRSGLEPIDTSKGTRDPRMLKGVETADLNEKAA